MGKVKDKPAPDKSPPDRDRETEMVTEVHEHKVETDSPPPLVPAPASELTVVSPPLPVDAVSQILSALQRPYLSPLDETDPDHQAMVLGAIHGETLELDSVLNTELPLIAFTFQLSERKVNDDGEESQFPIVKLILSDGRVIRCGSRGVGGFLADLWRLKLRWPLRPPLKVTPRSRATGKNPDGTPRYWKQLHFSQADVNKLERLATPKK